MAKDQHATESLTHTVRKSLFHADWIFELRKDALYWRYGRWENKVPYTEIDSMNLTTWASFAGDRYQCTVHRRRGRKVKITSHHYVGLGDFEDRSDTYAPFISELCRRVASANRDARFVAGSTGLWLFSVVLAVLMLCVGIGVVVVGLSEGVFSATGTVIPLMTMIMVGPLVWKTVRNGAGGGFDPQHPPASVLGAYGVKE